jgi:hypothetical protein
LFSFFFVGQDRQKEKTIKRKVVALYFSFSECDVVVVWSSRVGNPCIPECS